MASRALDNLLSATRYPITSLPHFRVSPNAAAATHDPIPPSLASYICLRSLCGFPAFPVLCSPPSCPSSFAVSVDILAPAMIMASLTAAAVSIPRFTGLKAGASSAAAKVAVLPATRPATLSIKSSLKDVGAAAIVASAASAILAGSALALDVKLGGDDGTLAFVPSEFSVAAGEKIVFKNNAGFPHNVVFDEDEVPSGVNASAISMSEEDLLNGPGEEYSVVLQEKGTYTFYCSPHQGAGMVGKVTVN